MIYWVFYFTGEDTSATRFKFSNNKLFQIYSQKLIYIHVSYIIKSCFKIYKAGRHLRCIYRYYTWHTKYLKKKNCRYVVMVTKHCEGFTMWPSKYSWNWNAGDIGPKQDLVGKLAAAVRQYSDMRFGVYHAMYEFYNPLFLQDQANKWRTQHFVNVSYLHYTYILFGQLLLFLYILYQIMVIIT